MIAGIVRVKVDLCLPLLLGLYFCSLAVVQFLSRVAMVVDSRR